MIYAKEFFDLQFQFACKVSNLSGLPFAQVLLDYTNLYIRFGLGRDFDPFHSIWQAFLSGLQDAEDHQDWTYRFYLTRLEAMAGPPVVATFGCFSYAPLDEDRIRLHFLNGETNGHAPLARERLDKRVADLTALFSHIKQTRQEPVNVVGASWLYNLPAYRRLFPDAYLAEARVIGQKYRHMPLWGQFLDRHGEIKEHMVHPFLESLEQLSSLDGLDACFPFQVLYLEAPVEAFYDFYGIEGALI